MKLKIAGLTASVMFVILLALGGFIYFTVYTRISSIQNSELANTAQTIGEYYVSHSSAPAGDRGHARWLEQYARHDQDVVIYNPHGYVIESVGHLAPKTITQYFHPVTSMEQRSIRLNGDVNVIYTILPVANVAGNQTIAYVVLVSDVSAFQEYMESLLTVLGVGCLGAVVLAGVGGYVIASAALRPIHQLIRIVEGIEIHRLNQRVPPPSTHDEVGRLALTFNSMLSRIERSFEQQTRFVADASHEIRTPLTTILGYANLLRRWGKTDPSVLDRGIEVIQRESLRLRKLADDLLILAGLEASRHEEEERASVDPIIRDVVDQLSVVQPDIAVEQVLNAYKDARVTPDHLRQIVTNVLSNALKYTPEEGRVTVRTFLDDGRVTIQVTDTGIGIPKEDLPHVFERFYRADKSRERRRGGNGLGLAIVRELVELHDGDIGIESELNEGTTIWISLPLAEGEGEAHERI